MRTAIIFLVVVVVVLVAALVLVGSGSVTIPGFNPPPMKDGKVDEDALSDWKPPNIAALIANYGSYFAPHADFGVKSPITVDAGTSRRITALKSKNDVDIAKIAIAGGGLLVTYDCKHKDDSSCSQTLCLCTAGSALTSTAVAFCHDDSQWKQSASTGVCTDRERQEGSVVVYPEARDVNLTPLGAGVTVTLK